MLAFLKIIIDLVDVTKNHKDNELNKKRSNEI